MQALRIGGIRASMIQPPATLDAALAMALAALTAGARDRGAACHVPALATVGPDGAPALRSVILRHADAAARMLHIHTDRRSAKAADLARDARAALHAYDPAARMQLRLAGRASLHHDDAIADAAWAASRETSRMTYAVAQPPGTPVPAPMAATRVAIAGREHFTVLALRFDCLDWLLLDPAGHRRARFAWAPDGRLDAAWIVP
jgi:pyridoxamine 5'-phosphate oxidase